MRQIILLLVFCIPVNMLYAKNWLIFYADKINFSNGSYTGHTYVGFARTDYKSGQPKMEYCWGFYPNTGDAGLVNGTIMSATSKDYGFISAPGIFKNDVSRGKEMKFVIEVDNAVYDRALKVKDRWVGKQYNILNQSCVNYVKEVVACITPALVKPNIAYAFPDEYLAHLWANNKHRMATNFSPDACLINESSSMSNLSNNKLSDGAALLFSDVRAFSENVEYDDAKRVKNPLTVSQMNAIFNDTKWVLSPDRKGLIVDVNCEVQPPMVELLDLNGDRKMEVVLLYGGTCLAGNTAVGFILYSVNSTGNYYRCMDEIGILSLLNTKTNGYYDIELGGPGFEFPIYKWNGSKYIQRGTKRY